MCQAKLNVIKGNKGRFCIVWMKNDFEDDTEAMSSVAVVLEKLGIKDPFVLFGPFTDVIKFQSDS